MILIGFEWIEITNRTDDREVDFSDGVDPSCCLQFSDLSPHACLNIVLKYLEKKAIYKTPVKKFHTMYLISAVPLIILSTRDNHLLVQVSSSETAQCPGKNVQGDPNKTEISRMMR